MRVKWLNKALLNLEAENTHIAAENPRAAFDFVNAVEDAVGLLIKNPALGRPGRVPGTRELVMTDFSYIVPYRVRGEEVQILRVFHTSRKLPKKW